jgi:nucleoside-diphosphate-sugar epimerase
MQVFVTGGTGYIGSAVVSELVKATHQVTGLARSEEKASVLEDLGATPVRGDLRDVASFKDLAAEHDTTIHIGFERSPAGYAADRAVMEGLLSVASAASGTRHVIYTSGLWVLGPSSQVPVDEDASTDQPVPLVAWRPPHERLVLNAATDSMTTSVIRPGMVYGGDGGILESFFTSADKGEPVVHVGDGNNRFCFVHREDLAELYRLVVEKRASGIFHGIDNAFIKIADAARAVSQAAGKGSVVQSQPLEEARGEMGLFADALCTDQAVVARRSRELGWQPLHPPFTESARAAYQEWKDS